MKIQAIMPFTNFKNQNRIQKENLNSTSLINNTDLTTPNSAYNQVAFKGINKAEMSFELLSVIEKKVKPFIQEHAPIWERSLEISDMMEKDLALLYGARIKPDFQELNEQVTNIINKHGLSDIDLTLKNQKEFEYLKEKSQKYFSSQEAHDLANELSQSELFHIPDSFKRLSKEYEKMNHDIANGLKNIELKTVAPELEIKKEQLNKANSNAQLSLSAYSDVSLFYKRTKEKLKKPLVEISYRELTESIKRMPQIEGSMTFHIEYLPKIEANLDKAEKVLIEYGLNDANKEALEQINMPAQRIVSRNIDRFLKKIEPLKPSKEEYRLLTERVEKQNTFIKQLYEKIECAKKDFFTEGKVATKNDLFTSFDNNYQSYDDIPF